jgi:hypothetical protein
MSATLAELLLTRRPQWHEPASAERWAAFVQDQRERTAHWSPATWARWRKSSLRSTVRYGIRRLRAAQARHEYRWQRSLTTVRNETVAGLRALGHEPFARIVTGEQVDAVLFLRIRRACVRALIRRRRAGWSRASDIDDLNRWMAELRHASLPIPGLWYEPDEVRR